MKTGVSVVAARRLSLLVAGAALLLWLATAGLALAVDVGPLTAIMDPGNNQMLSGTSYLIDGTVLDMGAGVKSVHLTIERSDTSQFWNGSAWVSSETSVTADLNLAKTSWTYVWNLDAGQNGAPVYTIDTRGTDNSDNLGPVVGVTGVTVDNTPPTAAVTFPATNAILTDLAGTNVTGTATDTPTGSGVTEVDVSIQRGSDGLYWDGFSWVNYQVFYTAAGTTDWTLGWAFAPSSQNATPTYTITPSALDALGNQVDSPPVTGVTIDNVKPTVAITSPTNAQTLTGTSANITGTASDADSSGSGSGVAKVEVAIQRANGDFWTGSAWDSGGPDWLQAVGTNSWSYAWTPFDPAGQTGAPAYVIRARSTDNGGNVSDTNQVTGVVINNAFTLTYTANPNGTIVGVSPQVVVAGQNGTEVTATPDPGYHFTSWSDNVATPAARTDTNVQHDITVSASFAINTYSVNAAPSTNGTITPTTQTVPWSSNSATLTITPDAGFKILTVTDNGSPAATVPGAAAGTQDYRVLNVQANHTIAATFGPASAVFQVWRFRQLNLVGSYLWTSDPVEKANIQNNLSKQWRYEGVAFNINAANPNNSFWLWRFRNRKLGTYFYTSDPNEKQHIIDTMPTVWAYEGTTWMVSHNPAGAPVWRFQCLKNPTFLWTADPVEMNNINNNLKSLYKLNGIAYYIY